MRCYLCYDKARRRVTIIDWGSFRIYSDLEDINKVFQYFLFSTVSLFLGYSLNNNSIDREVFKFVALFLPSIYLLSLSLNQAYFKAYPFISNLLFKKHAEDTRINICHSHALMAILITVYAFYRFYSERYQKIIANDTALSLIMLYVLFGFLHRALKDIPDKSLPSMLRFYSYGYSHIFAATAIAIPFLIGLTIFPPPFSWLGFARQSLLAYLVFMFAWLVLRQCTFKYEGFLDSHTLLIPSACCFIFPIMFFIFLNANLYLFYFFFFLVGILYLIPYFFKKTKNHTLANARLFLFITIFIMVLTSLENSYNIPYLIPEEFKFNSANLLLAVLALFLLRKHNDSESEINIYYKVYAVLPFAVVMIVHLILMIIYELVSNDFFFINSLKVLSRHLFIIEILYVVILVCSSAYIALIKLDDR